jgi:hypothetical protein
MEVFAIRLQAVESNDKAGLWYISCYQCWLYGLRWIKRTVGWLGWRCLQFVWKRWRVTIRQVCGTFRAINADYPRWCCASTPQYSIRQIKCTWNIMIILFLFFARWCFRSRISDLMGRKWRENQQKWRENVMSHADRCWRCDKKWLYAAWCGHGKW